MGPVLQHQHIVSVDVNLDENCVILDVIKRVDQFQIAELLRSERRVSVAERSSQERLVLFADVGLDAVRDVAACRDVVTLVDQGEGHAMAKGPREEGVVVAAADADEERQVPTST